MLSSRATFLAKASPSIGLSSAYRRRLVPRGDSPALPDLPVRTALTVATARFRACSSSAEAWAKPVASPATERRPKPWVVSYEALLSLPSSNDRLSLCSYSRNSSPSSQPASASSTILAVRRWSRPPLPKKRPSAVARWLIDLLMAYPWGDVLGEGLVSDDEDDLAKMGIGLHVRKRLGRLGQGEGLVDRQAELARLDGRPQVGAGCLDDGAHFIRRAGAESDADIVDALQRMQVEVELALHAAQPADIDNATQQGGGLHVLVGDAGRDLVDDQIDALACRRFLDLVRPFGIARIERQVAAEFFQPRAAAVIGRGAHDD